MNGYDSFLSLSLSAALLSRLSPSVRRSLHVAYYCTPSFFSYSFALSSLGLDLVSLSRFSVAPLVIRIFPSSAVS